MQSLHLVHQCVTLLNLFRLILPLFCIYGSLLHLHRGDIKCCQIGRVIYILERNFILILVDGLDVVGPEQQSPGPAAFSECSMCLWYVVWCPNRRLSTGALIQFAEVQATVLFSLLWIRLHG